MTCSRHLPSALVFLAVLMVLAAYPSAALSVGEIGDMAIRPAPAPPTLPAAGGKFADPTYGTQILRVTDRRDGAQAYHAYSSWTAFNSNSTRFFIWVEGVWTLYNFDPVNFTSTKVGPIMPAAGGVPGLNLETAQWHPTNPDVLYAISPDTQTRKLYSYNVVSKQAALVYDFTKIAPLGGYTFYLSSSGDGRYLSFVSSTTGGQDTGDFIVVFDTQTQTVYKKNTLQEWGIKTIHAAFLDKSGTYAWVSHGGDPLVSIWNFKTNTVEPLFNNLADSPVGHSIRGSGVGINAYWSGGKLISRNLATPHTYSPVAEWPLRNGRINWQTDFHTSWNNTQSQFFFWDNIFLSQVTGWQLHSGAIYKRTAFTSNSLTVLPPEGVYHNGRTLKKSEVLPTGPGQWRYDAATDTLYVWLFNNADARSSSNVIVPFAWWPYDEEIVQVWIDDPTNLSKFRRLAHHHSHWWSTDSYLDSPRVSSDRSGQFVMWTSNWGGSPNRDVFILRVPSTPTNPTPPAEPAPIPAPTPAPPPEGPTGPLPAPSQLKVK